MWHEWLAMTLGQGKVLLHLSGRRQRVVDADDIYYLEAQGDETDVRLRSARPLRDVRSLGEVLKQIGPLGFVRIHRNHAVNPGRVREILCHGLGRARAPRASRQQVSSRRAEARWRLC